MVNKNYRINVIIPAKNEERTIGGILHTLRLDCSPQDIIVVVDHIKDRTIEIANQYGVKVMQGKGKGKGAAIKIACTQVTKDIVVLIDADGSHKVDDIPKILQPIVDNKADLVIASRMQGGSDEFSGSIKNRVHYIGNIACSLLVNLLWRRRRQRITDCNNGFRAITTDVLQRLDLQEESFAFELEMTVKCIKRGYRIREVPSHEYRRQHGESHLNSMMMLPRFLICFIRNIF